jgi:carboxymethylenebutenolidase
MADVELRVEHGRLPAYVAEPGSPGAWPGVVVIHEAFGLTEDIRSIADRLARAGYLALAPDFLAWGSRFTCLRSAFAQLRSGHGRTFDELAEARRWLAGQPGCTGRVGVIGFCLGGGFALLSAGSGFDVAAVNYGQVPADAERALAGACPLVASFGARDRSLRGGDERLRSALAALGVEHDVRTYPDAGHSFMNHHDGVLKRGLGSVIGAAYHDPSAQDAWTRILDYFDTHLRPEGTP